MYENMFIPQATENIRCERNEINLFGWTVVVGHITDTDSTHTHIHIVYCTEGEEEQSESISATKQRWSLMFKLESLNRIRWWRWIKWREMKRKTQRAKQHRTIEEEMGKRRKEWTCIVSRCLRCKPARPRVGETEKRQQKQTHLRQDTFHLTDYVELCAAATAFCTHSMGLSSAPLLLLFRFQRHHHRYTNAKPKIIFVQCFFVDLWIDKIIIAQSHYPKWMKRKHENNNEPPNKYCWLRLQNNLHAKEFRLPFSISRRCATRQSLVVCSTHRCPFIHYLRCDAHYYTLSYCRNCHWN